MLREGRVLRKERGPRYSMGLGDRGLTAAVQELKLESVQVSLVTQSCPYLCDPMNHSTPGLPVHHQLSESTQTHVH